MAKTWTITDLDGSNSRQVTLAEFLAENAMKASAARQKFELDCRRAGLRNPLHAAL